MSHVCQTGFSVGCYNECEMFLGFGKESTAEGLDTVLLWNVVLVIVAYGVLANLTRNKFKEGGKFQEQDHKSFSTEILLDYRFCLHV